MKTLVGSVIMSMCVGALTLAAAAAPSVTYVVPKGTAGNTPTAPYDTWATAANIIRNATDATEKDGTVYVLEGTYYEANGTDLQQKIAPEQNVRLRVVKTQDVNGAPGTITIFNKISGHEGARGDADSRKFYIDSGTVYLTKNANNMTFLEYGGFHSSACPTLVVSGADAVVDSTSAATTYIGYAAGGYDVTFTDQARFTCNACRVADSSGLNLRLTVSDGAYFSCSALQHGVSSSAPYGVLTVSNATLRCSGNITVGPAKQTRLVLSGARPFVGTPYESSVSGEGTVIEFDLAAAELNGYSPAAYNDSISTPAALFVNVGYFTFDETASLELSGVGALLSRLREAGVLASSWTLIRAGYGVRISDDKIKAANAALQAEGLGDFVLSKVNGSELHLDYAYRPETVYVAPEGMSTPTAPYDTWATAANDIKVAANCVLPHGTVKIATGSYDGNRKMPNQAVNIEIVKSPEEDTVAGVATITNGGTVMGNTYVIDSPDYNSVTFRLGTWKSAIPSDNVFFDYPDGTGAIAVHDKLTITGPETIFDLTGKQLYAMYITPDERIRLLDHCYVKCLSLNMGIGAGAGGSTMLIGDGATLAAAGDATFGRAASDVAVMVSNATLKVANLYIGGMEGVVTSGNVLEVVDGGVLEVTSELAFKPFGVRSRASKLIFDHATFDRDNHSVNLADPGEANELIVRNGAAFKVTVATVGTDGNANAFTNVIDNASVVLSGAYALNGDSTLLFDVSKVALDGAPVFLSAASVTSGANAKLEIAGVRALRDRVAAAGDALLKVTLIATTDGMSIPEPVFAEPLPDDVAVFRTAKALKLRFGRPNGFLLQVR